MQLQYLLEKGYIHPSVSLHGASILFVRNKGGTLHLCIDYRKLNKITIKNNFLLLIIDDLFDQVNSATIFSKIDLRSWYQQIRIKEGYIFRKTFRTFYGHYDFVVFPFGASNDPTNFMSLMNGIFHPYLDKFVLTLIDDIMIYSRNLEEHKENIWIVLQILRENQVYAKYNKCDFYKDQIQYLWNIIS